jgi:cytochrome o ubiquinol oxidase subunit 2
MTINSRPTRWLGAGTALLATLLSGCKGGILDPKGPIGADEKSLILTATFLMLLVVVPVIVMTLVFAWKYRASNSAAVYTPNGPTPRKLKWWSGRFPSSS